MNAKYTKSAKEMQEEEFDWHFSTLHRLLASLESLAFTFRCVVLIAPKKTCALTI